MLIEVERYKSNDKATLSRIYVDGKFICYGLEDEFREVKVKGETRIPAGTYKIALRKEGGFHQRYSVDKRTKDFHKGMLWVRNVPNFEYILIHIGNEEKDTDGCLLVGMTADETNFKVLRSAEAYELLYKKVLKSAEDGTLSIKYIDKDR